VVLAMNEGGPHPGCMALVKAVELLAAAKDLGDVIAIVRDTARTVCGADGVCFILRDGEFCHYIEEAAEAPLWKGMRFPLTACISGWSMLNDAAAVIPDICVDPRIPQAAYAKTFVKSLVVVPVRTDKPIGAIGVYWKEVREFSPGETALVEALGRSASAAVGAARLRESLSESEHRLTMALEAGGLGAFELNLLSGVLIATPSARTLFGRDQAPFASRRDLLDAVHPDDRDTVLHLFDGALSHRDAEIRVAGGTRRVELRGRVLFDSDGHAERVSGVVRDVTEQRLAGERIDSLRSELLRVARANDLGAMASALAHELNQPLAAAANYLSAAESLLDRDVEQSRGAIAKAQAQFLRTKQIIQRIRSFVGQGPSTRTAENIESVCQEVLELGRVSTRYEGVGFFLEAETGLPMIEMDKVQIQQVLFNLARNAVEAMNGQDNRRITVSARRKDDNLEVRVADNGPGLSPDIAEHLFQPFHTTKEGGMGVGLSLCRKIVDGHGGRMWHEAAEPGANPPGAAFCFTLPLPLADEAGSAAA